jgi:hypothetical protein
MWAAVFPLFSVGHGSHEWSPANYIALFSGFSVGGVWFGSLASRLQDAGLPQWYMWPYGTILPLVCIELIGHKALDGPSALLIFVLLQIPTVLIKSKPRPAEVPLESACPKKITTRSKPSWRVGRFVFMLIVLLFAFLWAALSQLKDDPWNWLAGQGNALLYVGWYAIWYASLMSRFQDAGLPPKCFYPYAFVLLLTLGLPWEFKAIDNTMALMLFVLLQVPTVYFRSKPAVFEPLTQDRSHEGEVGNSSIS